MKISRRAIKYRALFSSTEAACPDLTASLFSSSEVACPHDTAFSDKEATTRSRKGAENEYTLQAGRHISHAYSLAVACILRLC